MPTTIDSLSDDVMCHILSFLPTKTSASTSVLSRRWRFLWAHVPNLNFKRIDSEASDIITRVIAQHRAKTINTLSLSGHMEYSSDQLLSWITHAVNRGVRNLYLVINFVVEFRELPKCLLTCKTLVDVKLHCFMGVIPSSDEVFWPSLKKLHLTHFVFEDDESLPHLLSGCHVLQELIMAGCSCPGYVFVSSLTLKCLDIRLECDCCDRDSSVLKINAPSLEYLKVRKYALDDVMILGTMTSLIEAEFNLVGILLWGYEENIEEYDTAVQFLHCLCNVKCLKIKIDGVEKLVKIAGLDSGIKFDNLTKLEIDSLFDFYELVKFLEAVDNLQLLIFTLCGMLNTYKEPKLVPTCMLSCLKTVRIKSGHGLIAQNDFESIRYVLRNGQVLERMEIHHSYSYRVSEKEELEMLERGSESCQLVFY